VDLLTSPLTCFRVVHYSGVAFIPPTSRSLLTSDPSPVPERDKPLTEPFLSDHLILIPKNPPPPPPQNSFAYRDYAKLDAPP